MLFYCPMEHLSQPTLQVLRKKLHMLQLVLSGQDENWLYYNLFFEDKMKIVYSTISSLRTS